MSSDDNATRTTTDGRQYPATRRTSKPATPEEEEAMYFEKEDKERNQADTGNAKQKPIKRGRPCNGMRDSAFAASFASSHAEACSSAGSLARGRAWDSVAGGGCPLSTIVDTVDADSIS